jgi:hypothetical protein
VRVGSLIVFKVSSADLSSQVESEYMKDKDSSETKNIIDYQGLIKGCESTRSADCGDCKHNRAEDLDEGTGEEYFEYISVSAAHINPLC